MDKVVAAFAQVEDAVYGLRNALIVLKELDDPANEAEVFNEIGVTERALRDLDNAVCERGNDGVERPTTDPPPVQEG
jgi:hypothetical protein